MTVIASLTIGGHALVPSNKMPCNIGTKIKREGNDEKGL